MEIRTLLRLGKSSLVVVLPKDWLRELNLKAGDKVIVAQEEDGSLKISPSNADLKYSHSKTAIIINADGCNHDNLLERILVANYLVGNDIIRVTSKKQILTPSHMKTIRKIVSKLRGVEIVEQTPSHLLLQCVADPVKFTSQSILNRMLSLIISSLDYTKRGLLDANEEYIKEVQYIEEEIDRLYWLAIRQILAVQRNRSLAKEVGIESPLHLIGNRTIVKMLELASDFLEDISKDSLELIKWREKLKKEIIQEISGLIDKLEDFSSDIIRAYSGLDLKTANIVLNQLEDFEKEGRTLIEKIVSEVKDTKLAVLLVRVVTRLIDMTRSLSIIGEIIINRVLEHPREKIPCISWTQIK